MSAASFDLASYIEHTVLKADATARDVERLCAEAVTHQFFGVCVNPLFVARARNWLESSAARVITVVGFPLGAGLPQAIAHEARCVVEAGAVEVDMVIPIGAALAAEWNRVGEHVQAVREACPDAVLKVILETGYLTVEQVEQAARAALAASPQFLKTSTGFGPRGASVADVEQLKALCPPGVGVKASGGIRTRQFALDLVTAGATRLGTSSGVAIVTSN
jgi:deoxyribose-phosphate aldolase